MTFDASDVVRLLWQIIGCALVLVLWVTVSINKTTKARIGWSLFVLAVFAAGLWSLYYKFVQHPRQIAEQEREKAGLPSEQEYKERYAKAKALFDERCKTAGEKINRTIPNISGVVWLKWRPDGLNKGQFTMDDPYGKDCSMEGCIYQLLRGNSARSKNELTKVPLANGYAFVETIDPRDGIRYRYMGILQNIKDVSKERFSQHVKMTGSGTEYDGSFLELHREMIDDFSASYGIAWDDVSTPEDREYWIAGGAIYLKNIKTNEIIAEHRGYLIDTGQGNTAGFRDPWGWAKHYAPQCPQRYEGTFNFAARVLQPIERKN